MAIQEKFYSAEDLWKLSHDPAYRDKRLELIEGVLIEMSPSTAGHAIIASRMNFRITGHADANGLGFTTTAEGGFILFKNPEGKDTVFAPDVGFVRAERVSEVTLNEYIPFAPDLAVEVVSPNDKADEVEEKARTYIKYGTQLVWVLYQKVKGARVYYPGGDYWVDINGVLDGGDVLPGLVIPLAEIFAAVGPIKKD